MNKKLVYLLCLSGTFDVASRVFADTPMYVDINGVCPGYCSAVPSNGGCCSQNSIIRQITPPIKSGQIFVGYTQSSDASEYGIDSSSLVVSSTGRVESNIRSSGESTLHAVWAPECTPDPEQYLESCDVARDSDGEIILDDGAVQYETECQTAYQYDVGTNQNSATASCHINRDYDFGDGCTLNNPESCTKNQCSESLGQHGYRWCWVDGAAKCYSPKNYTTPCCADSPWTCDTEIACNAMEFSWNDYPGNSANCTYHSDVQYAVYYSCGDGQTPKEWYIEVENGAFTPEPFVDVCRDQFGYEFSGWKVRGTDTVVQPNSSYPYSYDTPYIILDAQYNTCDAEHLNLCYKDTCATQNMYWCVAVDQIYSTTRPWNCQTTVQDNMCCYGAPQNCPYIQCKNMKYFWELGLEPRSDGQYCQASGTQYYNYINSILGLYFGGTGSMWSKYGSKSAPLIDGMHPGYIIKKANSSDNFVYQYKGWQYDVNASREYPTKIAKVSSVTPPWLPGHRFMGYYDADNCTGTKHIDEDGKFLSVSINANTNLYPCFQEIDTGEPSDNLIKIYISACVSTRHCSQFLKYADGTSIGNDPLLHQDEYYYGPLYWSGGIHSGSGGKFYIDAAGTQVLPHGLPKIADDADVGMTADPRYYVRDDNGGSSDQCFSCSNRNEDLLLFGANNNRSILWPYFSFKWYTYTLDDCGEGGVHVGTLNNLNTDYCSDSSVTPRRFYAVYNKPFKVSNYEEHDIRICQCVKSGCKILGWQPKGTNDIFVPEQVYLWPYKENKEMKAIWDCGDD